MTSRNATELFDEILRECAGGAFPNARVESARIGLRTEGELIALLGFRGDDLEGTIGMAARPAFVRAYHPVPAIVGHADEAELADWLGEMVNRLTGRIKSSLASYDSSIWIATPTLLRNADLTIRPKRDGTAATYRLCTPTGDALLWTELGGAENLQLTERDSAEAYMQPGESILFESA